MSIWHKIKELTRRGPRRINVDAHSSPVERAIVVRWGNTATINRTPVREREKGKSE